MPPTSRAFHYHMLRVHLQVNTWHFKRDGNGHLKPIITDEPVEPQYLLKDMKCGCQKPNKSGLMCTTCGCRKSGLPCSVLCKCNGECENSNIP